MEDLTACLSSQCPHIRYCIRSKCNADNSEYNIISWCYFSSFMDGNHCDYYLED